MHRLALLAVLLQQRAAAFVAQPSHLQRQRVTPLRAGAPLGADLNELLAANRKAIDRLEAPELSEIQLLRFALQFPSNSAARAALRETLAWRAGAGKTIVESAKAAVAAAMEGGGWNNEAVRAAAPHAAKINRFITEKNILTLSTDDGDLLYVIRASLIDDKKMMKQVSVEELVEFLLYVKEVHSLVCDARSVRTGRLANVIFANDITGVRSAPDKDFSKALTSSSESYEKLYPALAGPTMILNLPFILQAFVGLFKPLFPKSVQERLVFSSAPVLAKLKDLGPLTDAPASKKAFLAEVQKLLPKPKRR